MTERPTMKSTNARLDAILDRVKAQAARIAVLESAIERLGGGPAVAHPDGPRRAYSWQPGDRGMKLGIGNEGHAPGSIVHITKARADRLREKIPGIDGAMCLLAADDD